jgi:hypothetical protein
MGIHSQDQFPLLMSKNCNIYKVFLASLFTVSTNCCDAKFLTKYVVLNFDRIRINYLNLRPTSAHYCTFPHTIEKTFSKYFMLYVS